MAMEATEQWASLPAVRSVLVKMLEEPTADHQHAVGALIPDGLRNVHAYSLYKLSESIKLRAGDAAGSYTGDRSVALHVWFFHLLGGVAANLHAPPAARDPEGAKHSANLRTQRKRAAIPARGCSRREL